MLNLYILFFLFAFFSRLEPAAFTEFKALTVDGGEFKYSSALFLDYNIDGWLDIAISGECNGPKTAIFRNNRAGDFVLNQVITDGYKNCSMSAGDYDRDGYIDLVISGVDKNNQPVSVIYKNISGNFQKTNIQLPGMSSGDTNFIDFDRDGKLDISMMGMGAGYMIRLYKGDGLGNFTLVETGLPNLAWGMLKWADYDNDGYPNIGLVGFREDLIFGQGFVETFFGAIYKNEIGISTFTPVFEFPGLQDSAFIWGDYNSDGWIDFIVSGRDKNQQRQTRIYRNNLGSFTTDYISISPALDYASISFGDYNNNGKMDFIIAGSSKTVKHTSVFKDDGSNFLSDTINLPGISEGSVLFADFDKDKDLDLLITGEQTGGTSFSRLYKNDAADTVKNYPPKWGSEDIYISSYTTAYNSITQELTLTWPNPKEDDLTDTRKGMYYNIMVGNASGKDNLVSARYGSPLFGNLMSKKKTAEGINTATFNLFSSGYFWRIQAIDPGLGNSWAVPGEGGIEDDGWEKEEHVFIDSTPPTGFASIPLDDGEYTYSKELNFRWSKGTSVDPETGIAKFHLQVAENDVQNPSRVLLDKELASDDLGADIFEKDNAYIFSYRVSGGEFDGKYFARVRARQGYNLDNNPNLPAGQWTGWSAWSDGIIILRLLKVDKNLYRPNQADEKPRITYSLMTGMDLELFIYNLSGDLVRRLDRGNRETGAYTFEWDGTNEQNEPVASGIYLVNLKAGGNIATEKIAVIK